MHNGFQFLAISQLAKRFPADSWWAKFYKDFSEDDLVAYYEGDLTLPSLDLDWDMPFPQQDKTILIFINGHLTVDTLSGGFSGFTTALADVVNLHQCSRTLLA